MKNILRFFKSLFSLFTSLDTLRFIKFNLDKNKGMRHSNSNSIVLIEYTTMQSVILVVSLLTRVLRKKYQSPKFIAYTFNGNYNYYPHVSMVYKSFGVEIRQFKIGDHIKALARKKLFEIIQLNLNNDDLVELKVDGLMIGDLIYDHHLRHHNVPTLSIKDKLYQETLREGLEQFFFFREYIGNNIKAIHVTHQCYFNAFPLRIAAENNIEVFGCNESVCQRFSSDRFWCEDERLEYHAIFNLLTFEQKKDGLKWAKNRIDKRWSGEVGVDMHYSKKSAFSEINRNIRVIKKSDKIKILIATHCFFDAPNGFGLNLFPDFYIWLSTLGDISNKTDYDWYIKTHPDFIPGNNEILNEILSKYPRIKLLDQNTSHKQIVHDGIDFVLTIHGTVGFEYAAMGITVINASLINPHIGYDFNIHPSSRKEYINLLLNLTDKVKIEISNNDIYEFYYMRHYYFNTSDWLIPKPEDIKYNRLMSPDIYAVYINSIKNNDLEMNRRLLVFNNFVFSGEKIMMNQGYS